MLSQLRQARYGYWLALHVLLLCAIGRTPTEIAAFLFCSRLSVYRIIVAYRSHSLGFDFVADGTLQPPVRTTGLSPSVKRSLLVLLKATPQAFGSVGGVPASRPNSRSIAALRSLPIPCAAS